jgi:hypothetical protein
MDAEQAFSAGWQDVNHMQHKMSSQTFKARMAVGLWDGTPLFSDFHPAINIVEKKMDRRSEPMV